MAFHEATAAFGTVAAVTVTALAVFGVLAGPFRDRNWRVCGSNLQWHSCIPSNHSRGNSLLWCVNSVSLHTGDDGAERVHVVAGVG